MNTPGALDFDAYIRNTDFKRQMDEMAAAVNRSTSKMQKDFGAVDKTAYRIGYAIGGYFSVTAISGVVKELINVRGEFQKYEAVLTNSLGSQKEAVDSLDMLKNIAASTPFQLNALTESYVKLVNQGFKPTREQIVSLGDLASSTGKNFSQLTEAILDAQTGEFERLKEFGIKASKSGDQVTFMFKGQKTTIEGTSDAIRNYVLSLGNLEGVKGSMEAISKTLVGQVSNLQDAITAMFNEIGQNSEGILSGAVGTAKLLVDNYDKVGKAIGALVITFGAYKAATVTLTVVQTAAATAAKGLTIAEQLQMRAAILAANAQKLLNVTMLSNPFVAVATAVAAVVAGLILFGKKSQEVSAVQKQHTEIHQQYTEKLDEEKAKTQQLIDTVKNEKVPREQRLKALNDLKTAMPGYIDNLTLEKVNTEKGTIALAAYNKELENKIWLEANAEEMAALQKKNIEINRERFGVGNTGGTYQKAQQEIEANKKQVTTYAQVGDQAIQVEGREVTKNIERDNQLLKDQTEIKRQMAKLDKERLDLTNKTTVATSSPGSKPNNDDPKLTVDKEISYRKQQYEDYEKWVVVYGKLVADAQFAPLLAGGKTMAEYLQNQITALEARRDNLTKKEKADLQALKTEYTDYAKRQETAPIQKLDSKGYHEVVLQKQADNVALKEQTLRLANITTDELIALGRREVKTWLEFAKIKLNQLDKQSEQYKELQNQILKAEGALTAGTAEGIMTVSDILGQVAQQVSGLDDEMKRIIETASRVASSVSSIAQNFGKGSTATEAQKATSVIGLLLEAQRALDNSKFGFVYKDQKMINDAVEQRTAIYEDQQIVLSGISEELRKQLDIDMQLAQGLGLAAQVQDYQAAIENAKKGLSELKIMFDSGGAPVSAWTEGIDQFMQAVSSEEAYKGMDQMQALTKALKDGIITQESYDQAVEYLNLIETSNQSILDLQRQQKEYITGTSVSALTDQIAQMFEQGKYSAQDFAATFEDLMKNAMLQSLKIKALEGPLTQWFEKFSYGIGGAGSYWIEHMQNQLQAIGENASVYWEELQNMLPEIFGTTTTTGTTSPAATLEGQIKGSITEETGSLVAGYMNNYRINQGITIDTMKSQLFELSGIRSNTLPIRDIYRVLLRIESGNIGQSNNIRSNGISI